jgi:hypothetical protein
MRRAGAHVDAGAAASPRPLRADARRNRERIVKAARAVFADHGTEAQIDDVARKAKVDDAWEAFGDLVWHSAELNARDRGFCDAIAIHDQSAVAEECGLTPRVEELMRRAKDQGAMRPDATPADIGLMMCGMASVVRTVPGPDAWRRYLAVMLDGLRAA